MNVRFRASRRVPLNPVAIDGIVDGIGPIADRDGLYLFVTPHEAKSWRFDYRLASVRRTLTIGRFPEVGLTAARDAVSAARALVAQGISPSRAKQEKKAAAELDRKNTLKARAEDWYAAKAPTRSKSWRRNARRWLDGDIYPTIGDKPIRNVTAGDIEDLVKATAKKRGAKTAFYARLLLADVFRKQPRSLNLGNPARDVGNFLEIPKGEPMGKPLPMRQIPELLKAVNSYTGREQTKYAIRLLLHTFTRKHELVEAPWAEFDLDRRVPQRHHRKRAPGGELEEAPMTHLNFALKRIRNRLIEGDRTHSCLSSFSSGSR